MHESFPHSIVPDTEDDPVSQQTVLQAIVEIARFLKNCKCANVGIDCFFAHLSTDIEFVTFKCLPQNVLVQFFIFHLQCQCLQGDRHCIFEDLRFPL